MGSNAGTDYIYQNLIPVGLIMHSKFKDTHFVWSETLMDTDPQKLNNGINAFLINPNMILYYVFN